MQSSSPTEDSLSFFLNFPLGNIFLLFLLGVGRITPLIATVPYLGAKILSNSMKIGFVIVLVPIFLPLLLAKATVPLSFDLTFMIMIIKEVMIGFILGFFVSIPFYYAQGAGTLIDHQRGAQSLQVMDPATQTQASPIGILYSNILLLAFFFIGGPFLFFDAIALSYTLVPADQFLNPNFFSSQMPFWDATIKILTTLFAIAMQLAAPSLIMILMSDLFLGIANRMAPQVQISFLLWSLKAYLGIVLLWAAWWLIMKQMDLQILQWLKYFDKLIDGMVY
jgi:type III secretion protein T